MHKELIDTHVHLSFPELDSDLKNIIDRAKECGVTRLINIASGSGIEKVRRSVEIAAGHENIFNAVGIHPNEVSGFKDVWLSEIENILLHEKSCAVGETGLDFYRSPGEKNVQEEAFRHFIKLALSRNLPLVIHQRNAFSEVISILKDEKVTGNIPFVFHCFGGTKDEAKVVVENGGHISLTGIVTFKKADFLREAVKETPLEKIMLETDAPYLAPEPKRGKRNEPSYVVYIAKKVAEIKGISFEEVALKTTENAVKFFKLEQ